MNYEQNFLRNQIKEKNRKKVTAAVSNVLKQ